MPVHTDIQIETRLGAKGFGPNMEPRVLVQAPEDRIPGTGERIVVSKGVVGHVVGRQPQKPPRVLNHIRNHSQNRIMVKVVCTMNRLRNWKIRNPNPEILHQIPVSSRIHPKCQIRHQKLGSKANRRQERKLAIVVELPVVGWKSFCRP